MKKFLPILLIVFLAVTGFSGAEKSVKEAQKTTCFWLIYFGSGDQESLSNYLVSTSPQASCAGTDRLCWIMICTPNSFISQADLDDAFEELDTVNDWFDELDDDQEKTVYVGQYIYQLEKEGF